MAKQESAPRPEVPKRKPIVPKGYKRRKRGK